MRVGAAVAGVVGCDRVCTERLGGETTLVRRVCWLKATSLPRHAESSLCADMNTVFDESFGHVRPARTIVEVGPFCMAR